MANLLVALVILAIGIAELVHCDVRRECRRESKVSWAVLKKFNNGDYRQQDPNLKCYLTCYMKKYRIIGKDNELDLQTSLSYIPTESWQNMARNTLNKCKETSGNTLCDKAYAIASCFFDAHPEILTMIALV